MTTWFINGAGSGLGYALTRQALERGDHVVAVDHRVVTLDPLRDTHADRLRVYHLDMTDADRIAEVVADAFTSMGRIDVLINNAGYALFGALEELTLSQIAHQIQSNLLGPIVLVRAALPFMRAQKAGRIMQISSETGETGVLGLSLYQAGKWGIEGFCESIREEVAPFGIDVVLVIPGQNPTGFDERSLIHRHIIEDYQKTAVGHYRDLIARDRFSNRGNAERMAATILATASEEKPPRWLVLGNDTYKSTFGMLTARLEELEKQKHSAALSDS